MTEAEKFHQDRRTSFQHLLQMALIDFLESSVDDSVDAAPGMTGLREVARFMGDTMFRMADGTEVGPDKDFKTDEELVNHIFSFCSGEAAKTFLALRGQNPDMPITPINGDTPMTLQ